MKNKKKTKQKENTRQWDHLEQTNFGPHVLKGQGF